MADPTELVIIATFNAAIGVFVIAAALHHSRGRKPVPDLAWVGPVAHDESLPPPLPAELPRGRIPTGFYRPLDLLGIGFVFALFASLVVSSLGGADKEPPVLDHAGLIASIAFQFISAGIVTSFVVSRIGPVEWLGLRWRSWPWVFLIAPAAVFGMWIFFAALQASGFMTWIESFGVETVQDTVKLLQNSSDPRTLGLMAFAAMVAAPLCEEIVFRGYFYPAIKNFTGPWAAGICSALVFAAAHGSLAALLPLFIFGALLAFVYEKTGSIWAPIAVHCGLNSATVLTQVLVRYYHLPFDPG